VRSITLSTLTNLLSCLSSAAGSTDPFHHHGQPDTPFAFCRPNRQALDVEAAPGKQTGDPAGGGLIRLQPARKGVLSWQALAGRPES